MLLNNHFRGYLRVYTALNANSVVTFQRIEIVFLGQVAVLTIFIVTFISSIFPATKADSHSELTKLFL